MDAPGACSNNGDSYSARKIGLGRHRVTRGKVTFVSISSTSAGPLPWHVTKAVAEADIIWATTQSPRDLLRHAASHADIIIALEEPPLHAVMPFYDLASR